jgi:hypothetical protein
VSRSKRLSGVANAAPIELSHLVGGRSFPQVQLVQALIFHFLVANVLPNHSLIPAYCRYQIPSRPEMLTNVILFSLPVRPRQVNRALALDIPNHLRHCVFRRYRNQYVHMVRHQMAFLDLAFTLLGQIAEYLAQMLAEGFVKHLPAALRDKHNVILAIPFRMA